MSEAPGEGDPIVDLRWTADEEAFRAEARAWLAANVPRELPVGIREAHRRSCCWAPGASCGR